MDKKNLLNEMIKARESINRKHLALVRKRCNAKYIERVTEANY